MTDIISSTSMDILMIGELVVSSNFVKLFLSSLKLFNPNYELGNYLQGIPLPPRVDWVWGTNAGIRTMPILGFLALMQKIFGNNWQQVYYWMVVLGPAAGIIIGGKMLKARMLPTLIAAAFYSLNPWIVNRLNSGFWQLNIAYALLPILIAILIKPSERKNDWLLNALLMLPVFLAQPHFLVIVGLMYIAAAVIHLNQPAVLKNIIKLAISSTGALLLFTLFFWLPGIFYPETSFTAPNLYKPVIETTTGRYDVIWKILKFDYIKWNDTSSESQWLSGWQFIPMIVGGYLAFTGNKKQKWLAGILLVMIFLAKGINPPLISVNAWMYENLKVFDFFRDNTRFGAGIALAIAGIILLDTRTKNVHIFTLIVITIFIGFQQYKTLRWSQLWDKYQQNLPQSYLELEKYVNDNLPSNTRLLTIPNGYRVGEYTWYKKSDNNSSNDNVFSAILPLNAQLVNSSDYPHNYSAIISKLAYKKYLFEKNEKSLQIIKTTHILKDKYLKPTDNLPPNKLLFNNECCELWETAQIYNNDSKPIFAIGTLNLLFGPDRDYNSPIILLNQYPNYLYLENYPGSNNIPSDIDNQLLVITSERLGENFGLQMHDQVQKFRQPFQSYEQGKMTYSEMGQVFTSRGAIGSGEEGSVQVPVKLGKGKYKVLIKVLTEKATQLQIQIGNINKTTEIKTDGKLKWIDLGTEELNDNKKNVLISHLDSTYLIIDRLVIVPEEVFYKESAKVQKILKRSAPKKEVFSYTKYSSYSKYWGWKKSNKAQIWLADGYAMAWVDDQKFISEPYYKPEYLYKWSILASAVFIVAGIIWINISWLFQAKKTGGKTVDQA